LRALVTAAMFLAGTPGPSWFVRGTKDEALEAYKAFAAWVETHYGASIMHNGSIMYQNNGN